MAAALDVAVTCYVDIGGHTEYVIEASFNGKKQKTQVPMGPPTCSFPHLFPNAPARIRLRV